MSTEGEDTKVSENTDNVAEEEDLEKLEAEIALMEQEAAKMAAETASLETDKDKEASGEKDESKKEQTAEEKAAVDKLSIYVGQVDYNATPEDLVKHFAPCGKLQRVTINCDKFSGRPKGFAYIEFETEAGVQNALKLDGSTCMNRQLKVTRKRVNDPNYYYNQMMQQQETSGRGHGGRGPGRFGGRGRGYGRGPGRGPPPRGGGRFGGRGRGFGRGSGRGRFGGGRNNFHPYY